METSLALTALLMGLTGGPHCLAMCGAACLALGPADDKRQGARTVRMQPVGVGPMPARAAPSLAGGSALRLFLLGRLSSYAALGALAAASMQAVGWLSVQAAALRPLWTVVHVAAALLGLVLLWRARQPVWLEEGGRRAWRGIQSRLGRQAGWAAPLIMGLVWSFLPCGLLYAALLVAALSPGPWAGAGVMALFALGSSLSLWAGPLLWRRWGWQAQGAWAIRLAGGALLAISVWALWRGLVHNAAPWCVAPAVV